MSQAVLELFTDDFPLGTSSLDRRDMPCSRHPVVLVSSPPELSFRGQLLDLLSPSHTQRFFSVALPRSGDCIVFLVRSTCRVLHLQLLLAFSYILHLSRCMRQTRDLVHTVNVDLRSARGKGT